MSRDNTVSGIRPGVEITDKGADDLFDAMRTLVDSYAGHVSNAEAIGVCVLVMLRGAVCASYAAGWEDNALIASIEGVTLNER